MFKTQITDSFPSFWLQHYSRLLAAGVSRARSPRSFLTVLFGPQLIAGENRQACGCCAWATPHQGGELPAQEDVQGTLDSW